MRKLLFILVIFMFTVNIQSQEIGEGGVLLYNNSAANSASNEIKKTVLGHDSEDGELEEAELEEDGKQKLKRIKNRAVEIGLINLDLGVANNFISIADIFQEKLVIDFKNFNRGFNLSVDLNLRPVFLNLNFKDKWGIGLDIANISVFGNVNISGNLLQFKKTESEGDKFGVGAAAFADVGIPAFFHVGKGHWEEREFKVKLRLAGYVALAYAVPEMKYTFRDAGQRGSLLEIAYGFKVYTPLSLETFDLSTLEIGKAFGMDFCAGLEYPLFSWIDVGIDFINIPIYPAGLNYYMEMRDKISVDSGKININDLINGNIPDDIYSFPTDFEFKYGKSDRISAFRPFKMLFNAKYRPFNTPLLTLVPMLGFSINPYFVNVAMVEAGVKLVCDLGNFFIASFGIAYEDQMWKNSLDLVLNTRAFEFNLGASLQSQSFAQSWTGAGVRLRLGFKFGW